MNIDTYEGSQINGSEFVKPSLHNKVPKMHRKKVWLIVMMEHALCYKWMM
jgi:hypothetical protein